MRRNQGFTLVELMVTLAVFGILLFMGVPLTRAWVDSSYQREAAGQLQQGLSRARATALRNQGGVIDAGPAAVLCRSGQTLNLFSVAKGGAINCSASSGALWTSSLPGSPTLTASGSTVTCVAYNSRGLPVEGGSSCAVNTIAVVVGSEGALDVPLI